MLQIKNISKIYHLDSYEQKALDDVSVNFRDNEFVAILGPSGSGKTTLLNIIGGLDHYDEGDLIINHVSTKDYKDKDFNKFEYIDKWIIGNYQKMEETYIKYLDNYEIGLALNTLEKFFWNFCDNYIEIVKHRLYRPEEFGSTPRYSGQKTIYILLYKLLQDFSIFFPFITEEIYQELYKEKQSIHITEIKPLNYDFNQEIKNGNTIIEIISEARGEKSNNNMSLKTPITNLELSTDKEIEEALNSCMKDFKATLFIENIKIKNQEKGFKIEKIELKKDI